MALMTNRTKNGQPVEKPKYDPLKYTPKQILRMEEADRKAEAEKKAAGGTEQSGKKETSTTTQQAGNNTAK